jgi:hypothetical protein
VTIVLCLVAWALFKPMSEIVVNVARELRQVQAHRLRFGTSAAFSLAVIAFIVAAILLSLDWPAVAKPVPLTACYMALTAAVLNLINELFGQQQPEAARHNVDGGGGVTAHQADLGVDIVAARWQSGYYFAWLVGFLAAIWLVGFIPAIAIFVFAYMCVGFGESAIRALGFAAATALLAWGLFDRVLAVAWPASLLGDLLPELRSFLGFI